jgi:hypothetical protein
MCCLILYFQTKILICLAMTATISGHRLVWSRTLAFHANAKLARNPGSNPGDRTILLLLLLFFYYNSPENVFSCSVVPDSIVAEPLMRQLMPVLLSSILLNSPALSSEYCNVIVSAKVTGWFEKNAGLPLTGMSSYDIVSDPTGVPSANRSYSIFEVVSVKSLLFVILSATLRSSCCSPSLPDKSSTPVS